MLGLSPKNSNHVADWLEKISAGAIIIGYFQGPFQGKHINVFICLVGIFVFIWSLLMREE